MSLTQCALSTHGVELFIGFRVVSCVIRKRLESKTMSRKRREFSSQPNRAFLNVQDLSIKSPAGKPIVSKLSFGLGPGSKLAIIGAEGTGKSSLVRSLVGEPLEGFEVSGTIDRGNVGFLAQTFPTKHLRDTVLTYLEGGVSTGFSEADIWENLSGLSKALVEVGLSNNVLDRRIEQLSGGEQVRVQLARLLYEERDVLVLDEPTNYLDLWTVSWLEDFLVEFSGALCFVSHDELVLAKVANAICHLQYVSYKDEAKHSFVRAGYEEFLKLRDDEIANVREAAEDQQRRLREVSARLTELRNKSRHRTARSRSQDSRTKNRARKGQANAESQLARLARRVESEERLELPSEETVIKYSFGTENATTASKQILSVEIGELRAGERTLGENLTLRVNSGEKICIVGRNGCGKTTFLREVFNAATEIPALAAHLVPQFADQLFDDSKKTVIELLGEYSESLSFTRTLLARMLFEDHEVEGRLDALSGGQKVKVALLTATLRQSRLLLLDEPTTNLSPLSLPVLRRALRDFPGAVIVVSHDRMLIDEVADRVLLLDPQSGLVEVQKEEVTSI
jgi:ATP-binding cassette subfamily F protein 3